MRIVFRLREFLRRCRHGRGLLHAAVTLALWCSAVDASAQALTPEDTAILQLVIESLTIPDLIRNWQVDLSRAAEIVIANRTRQCALPEGAGERRRLDDVLKRSAAGVKVNDDQYRPRTPRADMDLETHDGRVIPRNIVAGCLGNHGGATIPPFKVESPAMVTFERADRVAEFRRKPERWQARHPQAVGVIFVARPVYSTDHSRAYVSFERFQNGMGGGIFNCMLERRAEVWNIEWQDTILIE